MRAKKARRNQAWANDFFIGTSPVNGAAGLDCRTKWRKADTETVSGGGLGGCATGVFEEFRLLPGVVNAMVDGTAITHRTGAMRLNTAPMMSSTSRSGRSMNPTLQVPISDSARARV